MDIEALWNTIINRTSFILARMARIFSLPGLLVLGVILIVLGISVNKRAMVLTVILVIIGLILGSYAAIQLAGGAGQWIYDLVP
jgi:CHASE2 domain-containing sensor protein